MCLVPDTCVQILQICIGPACERQKPDKADNVLFVVYGQFCGLPANHDAAGRLEAPHPLLARFNVRVVGNVRRRDGRIDAGRHHIVLADEHKEVFLHILAVSYPTATCLPTVASR